MVGLGGRGSNTRGHLKTLRAAINSDLHTSMHTGQWARGYAHPNARIYGCASGRRRRRVDSRLSLLFCRSTAVAEPPTQGDRVRCDSKVARAGDGAQAGPRASSQIERRPG